MPRTALALKTWATRALLAAAIAVAAAASSPAETERATPDEIVARLPAAEVVRFATEALLAGDPVGAHALAEALLRKNPQDRDALMLLSLSATAMRDGETGFQAGREAFRRSTTPVDRYEAARTAARGAYVAGQYSRAQFWLRRAALDAPTQRDTARTARDFRLAQSRKALTSRFNFGFSQSDNLNGGASGSLLTVDGVPFYGFLSADAQALGGTFAWASADLSFRLAESDRHRTRLTFAGYHREVFLSEAARDAAPGVENSDYAQSAYELGLRHAQLIGQSGTEVSGGLSFGLQTFGGEEVNRYGELSLGIEQRVTQRGSVSLDASLQRRQLNTGSADRETSLQLSLSYSDSLPNGDRFRLEGRSEWVSSDISNNNATWTELRASYSRARPIGPVRVSVDVGLGYGEYPDFSLGFFPVPDGRHDRRVFGAIEFMPARFEIAGFTPVLTVTGNATDSNVSRFQRGEVAFQLGIRSKF